MGSNRTIVHALEVVKLSASFASVEFLVKHTLGR